ncbi:MAG: cupin-like domain-containing protein [Rhizomicrobium sp.]
MPKIVTEVDPYAVSDPERFRQDVAERGEPVVLRGACSDWPAAQAARQSWSALASYLARFDNDAPAQAFIGDSEIGGRYFYRDDLDGFNFAREELRVSEALERIGVNAEQPGATTLYMGSLPADDHLPGLAAENRLPMLDDRVRPRVWIGNASQVACHFDTFENIACVVAGRRRFTLFPPDAIGDLYVGPIDNTMAGQPVGLAVGSSPGDPRYPRFERARDRALVVDLESGDALYLPKLWWHRVEATEPVNMLVNYWWDAFRQGPDAPYATMLLAMIAIAESPPAERAAWRAFFDHYVFRPDGHPLAHLPESKRGILGPLQPRNYGRIRAFVMQLLRGG